MTKELKRLLLWITLAYFSWLSIENSSVDHRANTFSLKQSENGRVLAKVGVVFKIFARLRSCNRPLLEKSSIHHWCYSAHRTSTCSRELQFLIASFIHRFGTKRINNTKQAKVSPHLSLLSWINTYENGGRVKGKERERGRGSRIKPPPLYFHPENR